MLIKTLVRFSHWAASTRKLPRRFNPNLNLKRHQEPLPKHDFINFKIFTGNEILYTLKDSDKLRPSELSCALIELGLRKGAPEGNDWNSHDTVKKSVEHATWIAPQLNCLVLTTLAHAYDRLKITEPKLWAALEKHISRTIHGIEPIGMAYCFNAFIGNGSPEFYQQMIELAPIHIRYMNGRDLLNVVRGIVNRNLQADKLMEKWIYPLLIQKKKMCSPVQLQEYIDLLSQRADFTPEIKSKLEDALQYKIAKRALMDSGKVLSLS